ncbi:MAG: DoxX family membrane protein [Cyanobacteria bacterium]|nr:DoxX family membrane protein [Cyanobacteriota bacterium]
MVSKFLSIFSHPAHQRLQPWLTLGLRGVMVYYFLMPGVEKLQHAKDFASTVQAYHMLPPNIASIYAGCLPWLEILIGLYLLVGLFTRITAAACGGLLLSFIIALSVVLIRGDAIECGCYVGGSAPEPVTWWLVGRDVFLFAGCAYLFFFPQSKLSVDHWLNQEETKASTENPHPEDSPE